MSLVRALLLNLVYCHGTETPLLEFSPSAQQRAFWLTNEIQPGTPAFNLLRVLQLKGKIDRHLLANAFDELVARHEILRTGLVERDGMILQRVHDHVPLVLEEQDFRALSTPEQRKQVDTFAVEMCRTAFDLAIPPHFKVALLRLAEEEQVLVIVLHHAIIDGSSMGSFFDELASLYDAGRIGKPAFLPHLAFQYSEFAERQ